MPNRPQKPKAAPVSGVRLSIPTAVFLDEAQEVSALALDHLDQLMAVDPCLDPKLPEAIVGLCEACLAAPGRRSVVRVPATTVRLAREAFRNLVLLLERGASVPGSKEAAALRAALTSAQQANPRPRGPEGTRDALAAALTVALEHRGAFGSSAVALDARAARAKARLAELDEVLRVRTASARQRAATLSPRWRLIEALKAHVKAIRSAASVAFSETDRDLYRKFTSAYERTAKRAYRERAKAEPVPTKAPVSKTPAKVRRPRTRRVELVQQATATARRERSNSPTKSG